MGILAFTGRKGTGFYPFYEQNMLNMQIKHVNGKYGKAGKSFISKSGKLASFFSDSAFEPTRLVEGARFT